ncbi:MAG: GNAT family N-acetyltransferase [Planctomycetes bacterium]|nr:GNAT family N-acetyltransferase [Planctomycetota bacterium]
MTTLDPAECRRLRVRSFTVRAAVSDDVPLLVRHRVEMMRDGHSPPADDPMAARIAASSLPFITSAMERGEWRAWIAEERGEVLGSGALVVRPTPPGVRAPDGGHEAYFLNFYTERAARRRGVATAVMATALTWCVENGVERGSLRASASGRPVYESLGFAPSPDFLHWSAPGVLPAAPSDLRTV